MRLCRIPLLDTPPRGTDGRGRGWVLGVLDPFNPLQKLDLSATGFTGQGF